MTSKYQIPDNATIEQYDNIAALLRKEEEVYTLTNSVSQYKQQNEELRKRVMHLENQLARPEITLQRTDLCERQIEEQQKAIEECQALALEVNSLKTQLAIARSQCATANYLELKSQINEEKEKEEDANQLFINEVAQLFGISDFDTTEDLLSQIAEEEEQNMAKVAIVANRFLLANNYGQIEGYEDFDDLIFEFDKVARQNLQESPASPTGTAIHVSKLE